MKQGIHDKDNPLLSPGSNSSNTNTNTNVGSPSSVTSPMMGSVPPNISNSSEIDGPNNTNGEQIMVSGLPGEISNQQSWTSQSDEDGSTSSPNITMSPNQEISSPHNSGPGTTSPYAMMHGHPGLSRHNSALKTEISSPTNGSPAMIPSYPLSNSSLSSSLSMGGEMQQVPPYVSASALPNYQGMQHPSMMSASFWYSSGADVDQHNSVHQTQHIDHRGITESGYLK